VQYNQGLAGPAWTDALIITMAVLALSITARALVATEKQS
jgi:hypothetical protein